MCEPPHRLFPKDAERRVVNRAHAEVQKKWKNAKEARHKRKILEREELEKHRRQQRHDGLPVEPSPLPSPSSTDSSSDDDESEAGWGPLDHLPDIRETAPRASVSGLASPGGGGEGASRLAIARPGAKADTPEARVLGKRAISLVGLMAEVEQARRHLRPARLRPSSQMRSRRPQSLRPPRVRPRPPGLLRPRRWRPWRPGPPGPKWWGLE